MHSPPLLDTEPSVGVLWYGGILLAEQELSMGELTSFLLYTFTVAFSIGALGGVWQDFMRCRCFGEGF